MILIYILLSFTFVPVLSQIPANWDEIIKNASNVLSGGSWIHQREAPWHAGIYTKNTRPYMQICGGTVVAKHVVITAAHCFTTDRSPPNPANFAVAAGKIYRPFSNEPFDVHDQQTEIVQIRIPPRYQGSVGNYQDDIALVIVSKPFEFNGFVEPACISFDYTFDEFQLQDGKLGKIVGWGQTGANDPASQLLQVVTLPSVPISQCLDQSPPSFRSAITVDKICAGYNNGTAVCHGDSGGGLLFAWPVKDRTLNFLRGVASTSPPDENSCNIYTWATFTHVIRHEHFIKAVVPDIEWVCNGYYKVGLRNPNPAACKCP